MVYVSLALACWTAALGVAAAADPAAAGAKPLAKERIFDLGGGVKLEMVLIPAGEFLMGSPDSDPQAERNEKPQHRVRITKLFYLGKYKVTQEQWDALLGGNSSAFRGPKYPVNAVSWDDCQTFIKKLNDKFATQGGKFQLPTEAQWEYACRAGSTTAWCSGDDVAKLADYAWHRGNAGEAIHPVGQKKPNAWGLYDMHGDLWEWCADVYDRRYYAASPTDDPAGPAVNGYRVLRGGSWYLGPEYARSARRSWLGQNVGSFLHGFRVALGL
jgi:formylglycine-generating enzyme required for sulfatase activity